SPRNATTSAVVAEPIRPDTAAALAIRAKSCCIRRPPAIDRALALQYPFPRRTKRSGRRGQRRGYWRAGLERSDARTIRARGSAQRLHGARDAERLVGFAVGDALIEPVRVRRLGPRQRVELPKLLGVEHEVGRAQIVLELLDARGADQHGRDGGTREHPGDRD